MINAYQLFRYLSNKRAHVQFWQISLFWVFLFNRARSIFDQKNQVLLWSESRFLGIDVFEWNAKFCRINNKRAQVSIWWKTVQREWAHVLLVDMCPLIQVGCKGHMSIAGHVPSLFIDLKGHMSTSKTKNVKKGTCPCIGHGSCLGHRVQTQIIVCPYLDVVITLSYDVPMMWT